MHRVGSSSFLSFLSLSLSAALRDVWDSRGHDDQEQERPRTVQKEYGVVKQTHVHMAMSIQEGEGEDAEVEDTTGVGISGTSLATSFLAKVR